jgi:hypothetical protein
MPQVMAAMAGRAPWRSTVAMVAAISPVAVVAGEILHLAGDYREPLAGQALIAWVGCSQRQGVLVPHPHVLMVSKLVAKASSPARR